MKKIGGLFGRSILGPLREHMAKVEACLEIFHKAVVGYVGGRFNAMEKFSKKVSEFEHEADIIKNGIRKSLSKSIFASASRGDVLDLIHKEDDISDACEDVVKFMCLHRMKMTEDLSKTFVSLADKVLETGITLNKAIQQATKYEEEEALGNGMQKVLDMLSDVQKKEWETDQIQLSFVRQVFETGDEISAADLFFLMNLSRHTVEIADHMENVADCLQRVIST